eukprot:TRINITY_DN11314_c0_g1_i2.p1 TRINITY_DN11314_c0_g1~~TRINITY_DN11314_c0_g1_i2.p1  ORF type:complete len:1565 (-),score=321.87 TRINITY_DN11314_c0_g1_i2:519-5213(-)
MVRGRLSLKPTTVFDSANFRQESDGQLPQLHGASQRRADKKFTSSKTAAPKSLATKPPSPDGASGDEATDLDRRQGRRKTVTRVNKESLAEPAEGAVELVKLASLLKTTPRSDATGGGLGIGSWERRQKASGTRKFDDFRRNKEREHQGAVVYDTRTARSGVLQSVQRPSSPRGGELFFDDFFPPGAVATDAGRSGPTPLPGSRPGTSQEHRQRKAEVKLLELKLSNEEGEDGRFEEVALREQVKQEYWRDYNEANTTKKAYSEFEEWQRLLHSQQSELSTAAPSSEQGAESDWRTSHLGFTRRTAHEEYVSDYARRCRERHYIPLGPRGNTPRESKGTGGKHMVDPVAVVPGVLQYAGWSLGCDRLEMLCQANGGMTECTSCDLSGNRIEDKSVTLICERLLPSVEALNLSHNLIGPIGIRHMSESMENLEHQQTQLLELNLKGNRLGNPYGHGEVAPHGRDLCQFLVALASRAPELRALSLAENELGRTSPDLGQALGSMLSSLRQLRVLDLHWNSFHGQGACHLLSGVLENKKGMDGRLSRLDLSWNRLGMSIGKKHYNPAQVLGEVLAFKEAVFPLFHLDISYNSLGSEDCAKIAAGLVDNTSLFGLHVAGNEAHVNEMGFLVPNTDAQQSMPMGVAGGLQVASSQTTPPKPIDVQAVHPLKRLEKYASYPVYEEGAGDRPFAFRDGRCPPPPPPLETSRRPPRRKYAIDKNKHDALEGAGQNAWENWPDGKHSISLSRSFQSHQLDGFELMREQCWICEAFHSVKIVWTPAISGSQLENDVVCVHAYLVTDDFAAPTEMKKVKGNDQVARWIGYRMVPKAKKGVPLFAAFRVNGRLQVARDLPIRYVPGGVTVAELSEADLELWGLVADWQGDNVTLKYVNEIVSREALQDFLVITEDSLAEGRVDVFPRNVERQKEEPEITSWDKSQSVLSSWREPEESQLGRMLMHDLKFCRITQFAGRQNVQALKQTMLPYYQKLIATYRHHSFSGETHHVFGASLPNLLTMMLKCNVFDRTLPQEQLSKMAFDAHSIDKKFLKDIRVSSDALLIRYQFIEIILRVAEVKYMRPGKALTLDQAVDMLLSEHLEPYCRSHYTKESTFLSDVMVEEVDQVLKKHIGLLHAAYQDFSGVVPPSSSMPYASNSAQLMSMPDWHEFLDSCDAYDDCFPRSQAGSAFAFGSMWQVSEVDSGRHMLLNFAEFLAAICAVVFMREFYRADDFADLLEEFILDQLQPVVLDGKVEGTGLTKKNMAAIVMEMFRNHDEDGNGVLTAKEFSQAMLDPGTQELLNGKKYAPDDVMKVFGMMDEDGSGELSAEEVVAGMSSMLKLHQSEARVRAWLAKELGNAETGEGSFTILLLAKLLSNGTTQRKLARVGVDVMGLKAVILTMMNVSSGRNNYDKLTRNLTVMFSERSDGPSRERAYQAFATTVQEMLLDEKLHGATAFMDAVIAMRKPKLVPRWQILIKQFFENADTEHCGSLATEDLQAALELPGTQARFRAAGLDTKSVDTVANLLDSQGNEDITEADLIFGVQQLLLLTNGTGVLQEERDMDRLRTILETNRL